MKGTERKRKVKMCHKGNVVYSFFLLHMTQVYTMNFKISQETNTHS